MLSSSGLTIKTNGTKGIPMSWISDNLTWLEYHHYPTKANTRTCWHNFYKAEVNWTRNVHGTFCCVLYGDKPYSNYVYIIPYEIMKELFTPEYLRAGGSLGRWVGNVRDGLLIVSNRPFPPKSISIGPYEDRYDLLHASQPVPNRPEYE
jgi:hypothetical protein